MLQVPLELANSTVRRFRLHPSCSSSYDYQIGERMDTKQILIGLRAELNRIEKAISALESLDGTGTLSVTSPSAQPAPAKTGGRRRMSAAGRKKIAEAQRKRWAAQKNASQSNSGAKQAAPKQTAAKRSGAKGGISAAGRKRISEMMKKRWAERRKQKAKAA
jgi:hypothetical protein